MQWSHSGVRALSEDDPVALCNLAVWDAVADWPERWRLATVLAAIGMAPELRGTDIPALLDWIQAQIGEALLESERIRLAVS
jgi:hypothetical protein